MAKIVNVKFSDINEGFVRVSDIKGVAKGFVNKDGIRHNLIFVDLTGHIKPLETTVPYDELKKMIEDEK